MKTLIPLLSLLPFICFGQTPQGINYQAVAYDINGFEIANQQISIRLGILQETSAAETSYTETHQVSTNDFGLFSLVISEGTTTDDFLALNWGNGAFLKVELDANLDGNYTLMGINSFSSVPYSLFAENIPTYYSDEIEYLVSEIDSLQDIVSYVSLFLGCNDDNACNYNLEAIMIYDNCDYPDYGYDCNDDCIDTDGDDICDLDEVDGCTDELACNYIVGASDEDGSCEYAQQYYDCQGTCEYDQDENGTCDELEEGCTAETAENHDVLAQIDNGSCYYNIACPYQEYFEYAEDAPNYSIEMCLTYIIEGCIDTSSVSFIEDANLEDGSCLYYGCMDTIADNFDSQANQEDGNCLYSGCTDFDSDNYWSTANVDDGSCYRYGCMLDVYPNYDHIATIDDGSCSMELQIGDTIQGGLVFYIDETGQHGLVAAMEDLQGTYEWGCYGEDLLGADGQAIGTGYQNTLDIVAGCSQTNRAAFNALNATVESYTDWYLPSKNELLDMYYTIGNGGSQGNIGGFFNSDYWSSSESNNNIAWSVYFLYGISYDYYKNSPLRVRCIRAF